MSDNARRRVADILEPMRGERLEHEVYRVLERRIDAAIAQAYQEGLAEGKRQMGPVLARAVEVERERLLSEVTDAIKADLQSPVALARLVQTLRPMPRCRCGRPIIDQGNGFGQCERRKYEIGHDSVTLRANAPAAPEATR